MLSILFFSYVSVLALCVAGRKYDTAADRVQGKLNVHLICHSHDDAGWLKTVDQYYWGANNSIQVAGVQYILDTVVQSLQANQDRRFVFSDMAFFMRWWEQQEEEEREVVSGLVQSGQLDFVGGGYVQHDEAAAHYVAMIDQTTRGHMFLRQTFGKVPRVGWQLDPFGHSSTQAGLLAAHMGFDALFFGRADYQDMAYRKSIKALEMVWRGSDTLGDAEVFTSNFFSGNYGPPNGFDYDWGQWTPPLIDDPRIPDYNVEQRVEDFVARCMEIFNVTRGTDIILPMGSDFHYANAHATYKNLDKLIHYVNKDGRLNLFYSTPSKYVEAKHGYGDSWPLKTDDFFPYADFSHAYWTGYFTSRPTSKGFIRAATSYLQAARQLEAFVGVNKTGWTTDALEEAVALTQHHDSITGTEKQHVANDYHQRLHKGLKEAQAVALAALSRLIGGDNTPPLTSRQATPAHGDHQAGVLYGGGVVGGLPHQDPPEAGAARQLTLEGEGGGVRESSRRLQASQAHPAPDPPPLSDPLDAPVVLHACDWLNVSTCQPSVDLSAGGRGLMVTAYNPLAWGRVAAVRVPVKGGRQWVVHGPEDESIPSQLLSVAPASRCLQALLTRVNATLPSEAGDAEVVFLAELPPTGYNVYFLRPLDALDAEPQSQTLSPPDPSGAHLPVDLHGCPLQQHHAVPAAIQGSSHPPMYYHPPLQQQQQQALQALQALQAPQRVQRGGGAEHAQQDCGSSGRATLDNGVVALEFDCVTGTLVSMTSGDTHAALTTSFAWYNSSDGLDSSENRGQASGAYIFRPNGRYDVAPEGQRVALELVRGEVVSEARQVFSGWATLVTRLYAGQPWVEVEWTVGPVPHQDGLGREVVLRYGSDVDSGDAFWTDANGREMVKRVRDFRPAWDANVTEPAAGNYYPLTAAMYIQDQSRQLALLTDRAQGGASLGSGELEVVVHRRTARDDFRGVGEPLNETMCGCTGPSCDCTGLVARGVHWIVLSPAATAARQRRHLQQLINDLPLLAFGPIPIRPEATTGGRGTAASAGGGRLGLRRSFTMNERGLPRNVHLLTLRDTGDKSFLVRLAHLFQDGEDPEYGLSKPITVDLNLVMKMFQYQAVSEMSLSGNQLRRDALQRLRFKAGDELLPQHARHGWQLSQLQREGQDGSAMAHMPATPEVVAQHRGLLDGLVSRLEADLQIPAGAPRGEGGPVDCRQGCANGELLVTIHPMEVRTFEFIYG